MPRGLGHERMRWEKMTPRQLLRRLGRITTQEKLLNFITVARERGADSLETAGRMRLYQCFGILAVAALNRLNASAWTNYREKQVPVEKETKKEAGLRVIRFRKKEESSG